MLIDALPILRRRFIVGYAPLYYFKRSHIYILFVKLHSFNCMLENRRPIPSVFAETVPAADTLLSAQREEKHSVIDGLINGNGNKLDKEDIGG